MDWLVFSLGIALAGILGYFYYLWTVDRRRAFHFLAEEFVALLFFSALAYFVLNSQVLVGGGLEDFSIQLALNRTVSLRDQFYALHSSIVQVMETAVVVDVIVSIALVVLTAGAAIPILQAFNTGFQAVLGIMEGAATLAGTAYMLLNHLYWLLLVGQALAFLIPALGGMLVIPRARKVALSGLAVVFVLSVLLPYAVNVSYENVVVPSLNTELPTGYGRVEFTVQDFVMQPIRDPVVVVLRDGNGSLYVLRVADGSIKYLPTGNYTALFVLNYWTNFTLHACCYSPENYSSCDCCVWPARFEVGENTTTSLYVWLPVTLIPSNETGTGGHVVAWYRETPLMPSSGNGFVEYELEPRTSHSYIFSVRGGDFSLDFPSNGTLPVSENSSMCWFASVEGSAVYPPGSQADIGWMRTVYKEYLGWWNRTRDAIPPQQWPVLEPPSEFPDKPPFKKYGFSVRFYTSKCAGNYTGNQTYATVRIYSVGSWNESNTRFMAYVGLWDLVLRAGEEVKGLFPLIQAALGMLYNIYAFVILGGLAFGGLLGVAGYTLPGVVQGYFRQGLRRSFVTLPSLYRRLRFVKGRIDERRSVVVGEKKRLAFELKRINATYGWSRRRKAWEKTKTITRHLVPTILDVSGDRPAPGLVRVVLELHDWWVESKKQWFRETTRGHYYLQRFYRAVRWTPLQLEEPLYRRLARLRLRLGRRPREMYNITLEDVAGRWPGYERDVASLYARHAKRTLEMLVRFVEEYKEKPYVENMEFAEAVEKGFRSVSDDEMKAMLKDLNGVLERLGKAGSVKEVEALVNEFYTNLHPHVMALMKRESLPDHNKVLSMAMENALTDLAREDPRGFLALMALQGDYRALRYLSLADWIYTAKPEEFGVKLEREELGRLTVLAYAGNFEALETLIGKLSEAELELRNFFAGKSLDELLEISYLHEMKVTGDLVGELIKQGLRAGFVSDAPLYRLVEAEILPKEALELDPIEAIQKINEINEKDLGPLERELIRGLREEFLFLPEWLFKMDNVARVAVFEAAALGLAPPLVETMLSLEAGESVIDAFNRAYPTGELARRLEEMEKGFKGMVDYLESLRPGELPTAFGLLWDTLKAKISAFGEEAEKVNQDVKALYEYRLQLSTRLTDLYWIVREKLEEYF